MKFTQSAFPAQYTLFRQWLPTKLHRTLPASRHCPRTQRSAGASGILQRARPTPAALQLLQACGSVSVPPFSTKTAPSSFWSYTPLEKGLLMCSLAGDFNSVGCSFPSQRAFISQAELGYFSVLRLECRCGACTSPSSVTCPAGPKHPGYHLRTCTGGLHSFCTVLITLFCISTRAVFGMVCLPWPAVINVSPLIFPQYCWNLCICWWFCIVNINPDKSVWPFAPMSKGKNRPLQSVAAQHWVIHTFHRNNAEIPHSFYRYFFRRWSVSLPWQHSLGKLWSI